MYKFVRFFNGVFGDPCVEFLTPAGAIKKRLITAKEKQIIEEAIVNEDEYRIDNLLYNIA